MRFRQQPLLAVACLSAACASIPFDTVVRPPSFETVDDREATLRVLAPSSARPAGGASVRLWSRIRNPNEFGFTLTRLTGDLVLDDTQTIEVDFPLGLPLAALQDTVIPLDLSVGFDDLPGLGRTLLGALGSGEVDYRLDAIVGIDAGVLGQPAFGPRTWLSGTLEVTR